MAALEMLIAQARLGGKEVVVALRLNTGSNVDVAKPLIFSGKVVKILEFLIACKLFRIKMRNDLVKE